jgi:hypothetical protein
VAIDKVIEEAIVKQIYNALADGLTKSMKWLN